MHAAINPEMLQVWRSAQTWTTPELLEALKRCSNLKTATVSAHFMDCRPTDCINVMPDYDYDVTSTGNCPTVTWTAPRGQRACSNLFNS